MNINSAKNMFAKITSNGSSLLRKELGKDAKLALKEGLLVPKEAKTYDAVRVGRKFSPNESYTDIFTFRDEHGQIINKHIKKIDGQNSKEITKGYETMYPWEIDLVEDGSEVMEVFGKKVRSHVRENGKLTNITEDFFAVTDEAKPYLTHSKKEIRPDSESILIEQRRNGEPVKFIKNDYEFNQYVNGDFNLVNSKTSSPELNEIAQNTYFLPNVSTNNKFPSRMAQASIKDAEFIADPDVVLYKKVSTTGGYYSDAGVVNINLKSSRDLSTPRETLVNTIGHEVGHAKWDEKCMSFEMYKAGIDDGYFLRRYSKSDIPQIKQYQYSKDNYITPRMDREKYKNQFCEKVAFDEGRAASNKYMTLNKDLETQFPYKHCFQFYPPSHNEDDIMGLMSLFI